MRRILYLSLFFLLFGCDYFDVTQYDVTTVPNPKTTDANAFVSNPDGILRVETVDSLNRQFYALERETSAEVAVVILNSIGDNEVEDFANRLFNYWGVGKARLDNGVLMLFVFDQRATRFEIGYGLEGILPDAICKRIQTQIMIPEFKEENYDAGILAGLDMVVKIIKKEPVSDKIKTSAETDKEPVSEETAASEETDWGTAFFLTLICFFLSWLIAWLWLRHGMKKAVSSEEYETNKSRFMAVKSNQSAAIGCIFLFWILFVIGALWEESMEFLLPTFGWAAGFFPANSWFKRRTLQIRHAPMPCETCGGTMYVQPKEKENQYLNASQQLEVKLKALVYDVFECNNCKNVKSFSYDKSSKYTLCPNCGAKTMIETGQQIITAATYSSEGLKDVKYVCKFCAHEKTVQKTIPVLVDSDSGSGSSGGGGGSFGGGSSGGGGSTSRW